MTRMASGQYADKSRDSRTRIENYHHINDTFSYFFLYIVRFRTIFDSVALNQATGERAHIEVPDRNREGRQQAGTERETPNP